MTKVNLTTENLGYVNGVEQTSLDPRFLVPPSKNVLIDNGRKSYTSRPGIEIMGAIATGTLGIKGHASWKTSKKLFHNLRAYDRYLEVWFNDTWTRLLTNLTSPYVEFAPVFDATEAEDIMCFVNGTDKIHNWSGGAGLCRAVTAGATTITLRGTYTAATIAFVDNGALPDTITDTANGFVTAGFASGDVIVVSGSASNNRSFTIATVTAGTLTLVPDDVLTNEALGASVNIHSGFPTWKSRGFLAAGTRKLLIGGVEYAYTGGEGTDTLTGVDVLPDITAETIVLQAIRTNTNAAPLPTGYSNDYIGSQRNQIWVGSKTSRLVFASKTSSYTDFTYSANRTPGQGIELNLDTFCAGFEATKDDITVFGGQDDIYTVEYQLSSDNTYEAVNIDKLDTAPGQGLVSPRAKTRIKNGIAFITKEPTLDTLGNVENMASQTNVPVSDTIKTDFDSYNFLDSEIRYHKRNIVISLPLEAKVLLYDLRYAMWQPPQEFAVAIGGLDVDEAGNLIGHSYVSNESYILFSPNVLADEVGQEIADDFDGYSIEAIARHYSNDGEQDQEKRFDIFHVAGYLSAGATIQHRLYYEIDGSRGTVTKDITALLNRILFGQSDIHWLGRNPLGFAPIGGGGIQGAAELFRFRTNLEYHEKEYYEYFSEFYQNSATEQFVICVHGPNSHLTGDGDPSIGL